MSKEKRMRISLADLKETFYVRQALDQARVDFFTDLYTSRDEVALPLAGRVAGNDETIHLVDGRHRKHALLSLEATETECRLREFETWADMVAAAVESNWGSSLPQTEGDLRHTVRMMMEHGVGRNTLYDKFEFIPREMMRKLMSHVQADIANSKMNQALNAVAEAGITVPKAAEQFGVDLANLKRRIKREKKAGQAGWGVIQINISNRFKETSAMVAKHLKTTLLMRESGELSDQAVGRVFLHTRRLIRKLSANVDSYDARFKTLVGGQAQTAEFSTPEPKKNKKGSGREAGKTALRKMGL